MLRHRYPGAEAVVVRDVDLVLAHLDGSGAALVVGTGAVVLARASNGREVMVDGRGFAMADRGGGSWIALEALRTTLRACDLDGSEPPLLRALLGELGLSTDRGVATAISDDGGPGARHVAALAPVVLSRADAGDRDAIAIVDRAVSEIVASVRAALRRAQCPPGASVVAAGGLVGTAAFVARLERALVDGITVAHLRRVDPLDAKLRLARRVGRRIDAAE